MNINVKDFNIFYVILTFMAEQGIVHNTFNPVEWNITKEENSVKLTHKEKATWIVFSDGKIELDDQDKETVSQKDSLLQAVYAFYPIVKNALEFINKR